MTKHEPTRAAVREVLADAQRRGLLGSLDLDLAILGAQPEGYARYRRAVRAEFAMIDDPLYRAGRRRMCLEYLARESIFLTESLRLRFEACARVNLQAELAAL